MESLNVAWGKRLAELRTEKGLSQGRLAKKSGVTQSHIAKIEKGLTSPGDETRMKLANALGVRVEGVFDYPSRFPRFKRKDEVQA